MSKKFEALFDGALGRSEINGRWVEYEICNCTETQRSLGVIRAKASRYPSTYVNPAFTKVIVKRSEVWQERYAEEQEDQQRLDLGGF